MLVERDSVLRYRQAVNHLSGPRLPHGCLAEAARSGLQDGSPWSGLLSLHARVDGVSRESWRDTDLAQVFGPRGAIYLVPRSDIAVFTLGVFPREQGRADGVERDAEAIREHLGGEQLRQSEIVAGLPSLGGSRALRSAGTTGTLLPTWDTVDTLVRAAPAPTMDVEEARAEIALRFFRYFGPASIPDLQWWLDATTNAARQIFEIVEPQLTWVVVNGSDAYVTTDAAHYLVESPEPRSVLMLPPDDVYINRRTARPWLRRTTASGYLWPKAPPPGAVVEHGEIVGTWRRRRSKVTVFSWSPLSASTQATVKELVSDFPLGEDDHSVDFTIR